MTTQHDELRRLASEEPLFAGPPDLITIRRHGRRLRTRRRVAIGAASLAVVAAIAVPIGITATGAPDLRDPVQPATSIPGRTGWTYTVNRVPPLPTDLPDGCGSLFGCPADAGPETGEVVGEPWAIGGVGDGTVDGMVDEVLYAVRPTPGAPVAVAAGFRDAAGLHRLELVFRPGRESGASPVHVVGGGRRLVADAPEFLMLGLVEEDPVTDVAWHTAGGTWRGAPLNDDLVAGYGVFWLTGSWDAAWPTDDPAPVTIRVDGREYAP